VKSIIKFNVTCFKQEGNVKLTFLSVFAILLLLTTIGCGFGGGFKERTNNVNISEVKEIVYRFIDGSVPPEYHRSYTIKVTANRAHIVVDSYGEILANKAYEILNNQFNDILNSFQQNTIRNCTLDKGDGCTGGTSEKISLSNGKEKVFIGRVYHCGGEEYGNLCGDISAFAVEAKKLVPDLNILVK